MSDPHLRLVADIGGTNTRFALARPGERPTATRSVDNRAWPSLADAARSYLDATGARPREGCFAVAAPISGTRVSLVNYDWEFTTDELCRALGLRRIHLINDFEAIALALPALRGADRVAIGSGRARAGAPLVVLGPGTGFGVALLLRSTRGEIAVATEGGHTSIGPGDAREAALLARLVASGKPVSRETLLSGRGLELIHRELGGLDGVRAPAYAAADIQARASDGSDPRCVAALQTFCALLGTAAGDQALACGALGGVYIAGGIVPRFVEFLRASAFRTRFERRGPVSDYVRRIPTWVITRANPGLLGAARAPMPARS